MKNLYIFSQRISLSLFQVSTFSSLHHPIVEKVLNPSFFSGCFTADGESSFSISIFKALKFKSGWCVQPNLLAKIELHVKNLALLSGIQSFFGVGSICINKNIASANHQVKSLKDLTNVIIPRFEKYYLLTKKGADFLLFKSIIQLMNKGEHLTIEGLSKILNFKAYLNLSLSESLVNSFPNIIPADIPLVECQEIKDSNWLAGFVSDHFEGCFGINITKSKTHKIGSQVQLRFTLAQHSIPYPPDSNCYTLRVKGVRGERDTLLFGNIQKYLGCGSLFTVSERSVVYFIVTKFSDIMNIIIHLFDKHIFHGNKRLDYADFCKVALLIKDHASIFD